MVNVGLPALWTEKVLNRIFGPRPQTVSLHTGSPAYARQGASWPGITLPPNGFDRSGIPVDEEPFGVEPSPFALVYDASVVRTCSECGCVDEDCTECVEASGEPCHWVNICSRCLAELKDQNRALKGMLHQVVAGDFRRIDDDQIEIDPTRLFLRGGEYDVTIWKANDPVRYFVRIVP